MSATDTIRAMLDERGVEWMGTVFAEPTNGHPTNTSLGSEHHDAVFIEYRDGNVLRLFDLTPDQAIDATLGRGECRNAAPSYLDFLCSECGFVHYHSDTNDTGDGNEWNYFPNCGKRVKA